MGCKRTAVRVVKGIGRAAGAELVRHVGELVKSVEDAATEDPMFWTNETKRRTVVVAAKARAKELKRDVSGAAIGALTEYAVVALKKAGARIEDIGDEADAHDTIDIDSEPTDFVDD